MSAGLTLRSQIDTLSLFFFLFLNGSFTHSKHGLLLAKCLMDTNGAAKVWQDGKVQPGFLGRS